jgi:hypothetical protein
VNRTANCVTEVVFSITCQLLFVLPLAAAFQLTLLPGTQTEASKAVKFVLKLSKLASALPVAEKAGVPGNVETLTLVL